MRRLFAAITITLLVAAGLGSSGSQVRASAADTASANAFVSAINGWRAANGRAALGVHSVLVAKAQSWADHMAVTGCLCHSNLPDGISVSWTKLGENIGRGPSVSSLQAAFQASPPHNANMLDPSFRWIGIGIAWSGSTMYVAEEFMNGAAPPPAVNPATLIAAQYRGRAIAPRAQGGYWVLDGDGSVRAYGAPNLGGTKFSRPLGRDIVAMPDGNGYATLDGYGGVHKFGSAVVFLAGLKTPYWGYDVARGFALTASGHGLLVLDGYGGIHAAGDAPRLTGPRFSSANLGKAISISPLKGAYVLDGFGGVHPLAGAPYAGTTYWRGWDIARDVVAWPDGHGYAVIDGFGGVHAFGTAKHPGALPTVHYDQWRRITVQSGAYLSVRNDGLVSRS